MLKTQPAVVRNHNASLIGSVVVPEAHVIIQINIHKLEQGAGSRSYWGGQGKLFGFSIFGLYAFVRQF